MSYRAELDDYHQECRYGTRFQKVFLWPKVPGAGNIVVANTSTLTVFPPSGTAAVLGPVTTVNTTSGGYTQLSYEIDARDTSAWPIGENYRALWEYTPASETGILVHKTTLFSVVREPYRPSVSLNNFLEEAVEAGDILLRQAEILADGRTAEQHASILANKAWGDVREWVRQSMSNDGKTIARSIMDHQSVTRVVVAQAMARMYRAEGGSNDSVAAQKYDDWKKDAWARFKNMPPMAYDASGDLIPDSEVRGPVTVIPSRSW